MNTFDEYLSSMPETCQKMIEDLKQLRERPDFHPEESAFEHVRIVTERGISTGNPNLIAAGLLHDIYKLKTARPNPKTGWPTSLGHDALAEAMVQSIIPVREWITSIGGNPDAVSLICGAHMKVHNLPEMRPAKQAKYMAEWSAVWNDLQTFARMDDMLNEFSV